jgi:SET domain-containing protein
MAAIDTLQLEPIPNYPIFVIRTLRDIAPDEEITVDYGKDYFKGQSCLCSHCVGTPPSYTSNSIVSLK